MELGLNTYPSGCGEDAADVECGLVGSGYGTDIRISPQ